MNFKTPFIAPVVALFLSVATVPMGAVAQSSSAVPETGPGSPSCQLAPDAIINLEPPRYGFPSVWDALFGDPQALVEFSGAVALENRNLLMAGEALDLQYNPTSQFLVELDSRGRTIAEKRNPAKPGETTAGLIKVGDGFVVASSMDGGKKDAERWARLAWYDASYNFLRDVTLKDAAFNYEAMSLTPGANGTGFVVAIKATSRHVEGDGHAVLVRFGADGKTMWKRSYSPGANNNIYNIAVADSTHYMATGQIKHEDGRMAGWLLKLNDDGTIAWQNTYPRGQFAVLRHAMPKGMANDSDHYIVTGQVVPYGDIPGAAWVLEVNNTGSTVWQRYFRSPGFDIDGRAADTYADGRVSVLANAKTRDKENETQNHIRLLTLSPRGILLKDEAYLEGHAAEARQLIRGWGGERIVTAVSEVKKTLGAERPELITEALVRQEKEKAMAEATAKVGYGPPAPSVEYAALVARAAEKEVRHEGWVFVATRVGVYNDPCIISQSDPAP